MLKFPSFQWHYLTFEKSTKTTSGYSKLSLPETVHRLEIIYCNHPDNTEKPRGGCDQSYLPNKCKFCWTREKSTLLAKRLALRRVHCVSTVMQCGHTTSSVCCKILGYSLVGKSWSITSRLSLCWSLRLQTAGKWSSWLWTTVVGLEVMR